MPLKAVMHYVGLSTYTQDFNTSTKSPHQCLSVDPPTRHMQCPRSCDVRFLSQGQFSALYRAGVKLNVETWVIAIDMQRRGIQSFTNQNVNLDGLWIFCPPSDEPLVCCNTTFSLLLGHEAVGSHVLSPHPQCEPRLSFDKTHA